MCCKLLVISKDQRKMDKGTPYLKESFYLLFSTMCKVWCLKLAVTIKLYEELAATNRPEKKTIIHFSQLSRKFFMYTGASGIEGLGREKTGRTNGLTTPSTAATAEVNIDCILPPWTESSIFSPNGNKWVEFPSTKTGCYWQNTKAKQTLLKCSRRGNTIPLPSLAFYVEVDAARSRNITIHRTPRPWINSLLLCLLFEFLRNTELHLHWKTQHIVKKLWSLYYPIIEEFKGKKI